MKNNACESQYLMKLKCKKIRFKGITFHSRGKKKWLVSQVWSNILWRILICYVLFFFCCSKNSERLPNLTTLLFRFIKWYVTQRLKNCRYVPRCKTHDKTLTSGIVELNHPVITFLMSKQKIYIYTFFLKCQPFCKRVYIHLILIGNRTLSVWC